MSRFLLIPFVALFFLTACSPEQKITDLGEVAGCDAATSSCTLRDDGMAVTATLGPDVVPLKSFPIKIALHGFGGIKKGSVIADFQMKGMDMGINRYRLQHTDSGNWRADVTLPVCTASRMDWYVSVEFTAKGEAYRAIFPFETQGN